MEHLVALRGPGKLGYECTCGKTFPTERAAIDHANAENIQVEAQRLQEEADVRAPAESVNEETGEINPVPAQYAKAEQEVKVAVDKEPEETSEASKPRRGRPSKAEVAPENQIVVKPEEKGSQQIDFDKLSPFDQSRLQVQKLAAQLVGSDWANEFMLNLTIMARNESRITKCAPESIVKALKACIDARIMPNTFAQHAMVAPYWNSKTGTYELQFQIMKNGLIELARRTGEVKTINVELVYESDEFDVEYGTDRKLHHKPNFNIDRTDGSKVTHAYMTALLTNGEKPFEVVTKAELDKIKKKAIEGKKGSPWLDWEPEMQKKTAIKRGAKLLPSSPEMQKAIQYDSLEEAGKLAITKDGNLIEGSPDMLPRGAEVAINSASSRQELNSIIQGLTIPQRKAAVELVQIRMKELT